MDRLEAGVKKHIQVMQDKRDELVSQARPPQAVQLGAGLNRAYSAALRMGMGQHTSVLDRARTAAEDYLTHLPPERRGVILLGALASVYGKEDGGADTAVWLAGDKEALGSDSVAHQTIVVLQELGVLDDIIVTKEGLVVYAAVS